jgi:DNA-binding NtrC family response regulator
MNGEISGGSETILFVDDEELILEVGQLMMDKLGYTVLTARNGQQALDVYRSEKERIHMVILDVMLPDMGGKDVYEKLKEIHTGVRVLLSSGYTVDGRAGEIMELGCNDFIQKPFDLKRLSHKIRHVLDCEKSAQSLQMAF